MVARRGPARHYATLGVRPNATADEIKKASRAAAKRHHPDTHPDDPEATARMAAVKENLAPRP